MAVQKEVNSQIEFGDPSVVNGLSVKSPEFDETYYYDGDDLGNQYSKEQTTFCLWAPTASEVTVRLYEQWNQEQPTQEIQMKRAEKGIWRLTIEQDLEGMLYTYKVKIGMNWNEAIDPYAKAVGVNGDRGAIIDLNKTNPPHWNNIKPPFLNSIDAIIYEVHVRDLSIHPQSGIHNKGKFLGAAETGTTGPQGVKTGLNHILDLGVTHVQFLPIFDYCTLSVDETKLHEPQFNWGYDPKNYNVPEGSYATDPYDPYCRIKELKQMIQTLHDHGLRVIMDVVYNHVYDVFEINFTKLVPGYYFRYWPDGKLSNGSACGNDTASERKMMRKFIIDSVLYWAKEYHIDGFRFDLMGLHDIQTMNEIRQKLDEIDPSIIMIGEGWNLGTALDEDKKANQNNAYKLPNIGQFNDHIRDHLKGSVFYYRDRGFINGKPYLEHEMKKGIVGGIPYSRDICTFAAEPNQTVTYVEAHDNHTLWDRLQVANSELDEYTRKKIHKFCSSILLTSQGISFIHAGQEFMRTKNGIENSYRSPTEVNQLDWERCAEFAEEVKYMRELIALRKNHPAFRMKTAEQIRNHLFFEHAEYNCIAFTIRNHANGDSAKHLYIAHNANGHGMQFMIPPLGEWNVIFGKNNLIETHGQPMDRIILDRYSTVVLGCVM